MHTYTTLAKAKTPLPPGQATTFKLHSNMGGVAVTLSLSVLMATVRVVTEELVGLFENSAHLNIGEWSLDIAETEDKGNWQSIRCNRCIHA